MLKVENGSLLIKNGALNCKICIKFHTDDNHFSLIAKLLESNERIVKIEWTSADFPGTIGQTFFLDQKQDILQSRFEFEVKTSQKIQGICKQEFQLEPALSPYFMIPGNVYGTNNLANSKSIQPQLNYRGDICYPKTPTYFTRADRSTHNTVLSIDDNSIIAVRIDESTWQDSTPYFNGLGIDTNNDNPYDVIALTLGYQHFPLHYFGKVYEGSVSKESETYDITYAPESTYKTQGHIYINTAKNLFAYEDALKYFYSEIHTPPNNNVERETAINDLTHALITDTYIQEHHYFPTVLSGEAPNVENAGDMAWTGGMQVAYPLLRAASYVEEAKHIALDFINHLVDEGMNEKAGMFYESKLGDEWRVSGWWKKDLVVYSRNNERLDCAHSAYINGQATCYLLKSFQYAEEQGWQVAQDKWFTTAKGIIDRVIAQQRYDGALGVYFDPRNGEAIYFNSFQGAWFLAGIAELAKITKEKKYIEIFDRANDFYFAFLERVEVWGTPIDTQDAVDEEGNLAYITALKTMHEVTQRDSLLSQLVHALNYEYTWKFAYNTRHVNEPLKSLKWPSCGGSITSSHNIHVHQMGNLIAEEMYYAYKLTQDPYILSRLNDTINWGLGAYNNGDERWGYGKKGWATEQFYHTDGVQDYEDRISEGGIWKDYLSWAAACVLLSSVSNIDDEHYRPVNVK